MEKDFTHFDSRGNAEPNHPGDIPENIQKEMGMSEGLIRFSVGLDNDIEHTFNIIHEILKEKKLVSS
jgi:methionine-gamma-lyase